VRPAALVAFGGAATAVISLLLAAASGGPYLTGERVNGWVVVFAVALLVVLLVAPFLIERWLRGRRTGPVTSVPHASDEGAEPVARGRRGQTPLRDERWEGAALGWGAIALAALAIAIPVGLAESFSGHSLAGTAALLATIEAGLVLGTLLLWLLSG
jgi:hypothetical protein